MYLFSITMMSRILTICDLVHRHAFLIAVEHTYLSILLLETSIHGAFLSVCLHRDSFMCITLRVLLLFMLYYYLAFVMSLVCDLLHK